MLRRNAPDMSAPIFKFPSHHCGSAAAAAIPQLQRPVLDGAFPRVRCATWIAAGLLVVLIGIQLGGTVIAAR